MWCDAAWLVGLAKAVGIAQEGQRAGGACAQCDILFGTREAASLASQRLTTQQSAVISLSLTRALVGVHPVWLVYVLCVCVGELTCNYMHDQRTAKVQRRP